MENAICIRGLCKHYKDFSLESLNLSETMVNQPIPFTPKVRASPNSFVLPPVTFPTPLVYAICCRQPKTVKFLIEKGARLDVPVGTWYPIHFAVATRDVRVVEAILSTGAESELERCTIDDGATPLHVAVSGGQLEVVLFLLRHGCDANCVNKMKQTPRAAGVSGEPVAEGFAREEAERHGARAE